MVREYLSYGKMYREACESGESMRSQSWGELMLPLDGSGITLLSYI